MFEFEILTKGSSLSSTQDAISGVQITLKIIVHRFSMVPPYTQTSVNFNNPVI